MKGLTTAASLWAVAAIGLSIGGGLYVPALATTVLVIAILAGLKPVAERWRDRQHTREVRMLVRRGSLSVDTLQAVTGERASRVRQFVLRPGEDPDQEEVTVSFVGLSRTSVEALVRRLKENPDTFEVEAAGS